MKVRLLILFLFISMTVRMTTAQSTKKISWSVTAGGQLTDMNYGLDEAENLIAEPAAFLSFRAGGQAGTGFFGGLGGIYTLHKSFQLGSDLIFSFNRYKIEGENKDQRINAPRPQDPGYPVKLTGHMIYTFAGISLYGSYHFKHGLHNSFTLKPVFQYHFLMDHRWNVDVRYQDNSVRKVQTWGSLVVPDLNNLWWAGLEIGYRMSVQNGLFLHPALGFHRSLNRLHPDHIPPQNLTFSLRLSGI